MIFVLSNPHWLSPSCLVPWTPSMSSLALMLGLGNMEGSAGDPRARKRWPSPYHHSLGFWPSLVSFSPSFCCLHTSYCSLPHPTLLKFFNFSEYVAPVDTCLITLKDCLPFHEFLHWELQSMKVANWLVVKKKQIPKVHQMCEESLLLKGKTKINNLIKGNNARYIWKKYKELLFSKIEDFAFQTVHLQKGEGQKEKKSKEQGSIHKKLSGI